MTNFIPDGWRTLTPRIVAKDAKDLIEFLRKVFGAKGEFQEAFPSMISIGDSMVMISEAGIRPPMTAFLYVYVPATDQTYQRAVEAGARTIEAPANLPYGDRRCMVEDPWGNTWQIATHLSA